MTQQPPQKTLASLQQAQRGFLRTAVASAVLAGAGLASFSALAAGSAPAQRPDAAARAEIQKTYRAERAACIDGSSTQERSACLAEAAAARQEALAGRLGLQTVASSAATRPAEPDLLANALARCDAIPSEVRADCERRVLGGDGVIVVGSVAEGAILRELAPAEPVLMLAQADAAPAPAAAPALAQAEAWPAPAEAQDTIVAEPTEPVMEAPPAIFTPDPQAAAPAMAADAGLSPGETLLTQEMTQAEAAADAQAQADAQRLEQEAAQGLEQEAAPRPEQDAAQPADEPTAAEMEGRLPAASAYPAWMVQQRFE